MKRLLLASALTLSPFVLSATAEAQGTVRGAERGAEDGNRAAGPVGGVVGGAVGHNGFRAGGSNSQVAITFGKLIFDVI